MLIYVTKFYSVDTYQWQLLKPTTWKWTINQVSLYTLFSPGVSVCHPRRGVQLDGCSHKLLHGCDFSWQPESDWVMLQLTSDDPFSSLLSL